MPDSRTLRRRTSTGGLPETFLSGYPFWLELIGGARFDNPAKKRAYAAYLEAAVAMDSAEVRQITETARDLGRFVYLGGSAAVEVPSDAQLVAHPYRGTVVAACAGNETPSYEIGTRAAGLPTTCVR